MILDDIEIVGNVLAQEVEQAERARSPTFEDVAAPKSEFGPSAQRQVLPMRRESGIHIVAQPHASARTDVQLTGEPILCCDLSGQI
jgi:hypothetical protein